MSWLIMELSGPGLCVCYSQIDNLTEALGRVMGSHAKYFRYHSTETLPGRFYGYEAATAKETLFVMGVTHYRIRRYVPIPL